MRLTLLRIYMFSVVDRPRQWFSRNNTSNSTSFHGEKPVINSIKARATSGLVSSANCHPVTANRTVILFPSLRVRVCTLSLTLCRRLCLSTPHTRVHERIYSRRRHYWENYDAFQDVTMSASIAVVASVCTMGKRSWERVARERTMRNGKEGRDS